MHSSELKQLQLIVERLKEENRSLKAELNLHHKLEEQTCLIQKMDAVTAFSRRIAHDFNNILHLLLRYVELALIDKTENSPDYQELNEIKSNIINSGELTEQLLEIGGSKKPDFSPQNLNSILLDAKKLLRPSIPATIDVRLSLADDLMTINASPDQCKKILLNLCINAKDAIAEKGEIKIETQNLLMDHSDLSQALVLPQNNYVRLTVTDNGSGIPYQYLNHIYDPFFTTKENPEHPGLGLAKVYGIVRNHAGYIECVSLEGKGTTFNIYLPALNEGQQHPKKTPRILGFGSRKNTKTILIIDDEATILEIGQAILERHGYNVLVARNGEEGLSLYSKFPVDLVLLDLGLPGIGGMRCLKKLLAANHKAKIIIVSGDLSNGQVQEALQMGARAFLAKPFGMAELLNTIVEVLGQSQAEKSV
jgi:signal transduction histidine kinase/CheY-like chemotaxis protein